MSDSQRPAAKDDQTLPADAEDINREQVESPPKSYYYDDSTGYEVYDGQDENNEEDDCQADESHRHS
jgi:hypothetical protein